MSMKKLVPLMVLAFVLVFCAVGSAGASSFEDIKDKWGPFDAKSVTEGTDYSWTHVLSDYVDFSSQTISSATFQLDFTNDTPSLDFLFPEYVSVSFDAGANWYNLGEVDDGQYEITLGATEIAYMNLNQSLEVLLSVDGSSCLPGSVWIDHLKVYGETTAAPIPGAAWLLGSGLIGLVGIRKRFRKS